MQCIEKHKDIATKQGFECKYAFCGTVEPQLSESQLSESSIIRTLELFVLLEYLPLIVLLEYLPIYYNLPTFMTIIQH